MEFWEINKYKYKYKILGLMFKVLFTLDIIFCARHGFAAVT